jgi:hypothetical protein
MIDFTSLISRRSALAVGASGLSIGLIGLSGLRPLPAQNPAQGFTFALIGDLGYVPYGCFSNRPSGSSAFRPSTTPVSMSLAGSRFSSDSAPRPFHHGIRRRGGTIFWATLPSM